MSTDHAPSQPALDLVDLSERFEGHADLLIELMHAFRHDHRADLREIRAAIERDDPTAVEYAAHAMRGSLAAIGGRVGAHAAARLEVLAHRRNLAGATELYRALEASVAEFLEASSALELGLTMASAPLGAGRRGSADG